jgi:hypothetical protein
MADNANNPKAVKLDGQQKTTDDGPHRGGNKYNQMTLGQGFLLQTPINGHTQKPNIKVPKK